MSGGAGSNSGVIDSGSITGKATFSNVADNSGILVFAEAVTGTQTLSVRAALSTGIAQAVSARSVAGSTVAAQTITASDGSFTLSDLAAGTYTVYAVSNDSSEGAVARTVTVSADTVATVETLVLTATGTVSGSVTWNGNSSGNGGILVYIAGTGYMAYTDDAGSFKITGVPAASAYQLYIVGKDGATKYTSNKGDDPVMYAKRTISWKTVDVTAKTDTAAGAYVWHPYLAETEHVKVESDPNGIKFTVKLPADTSIQVYNDDDNTRYNPVTSGMGTYTFVYPLVTVGKTYKFHVAFIGPLFAKDTYAEYNEYVGCVAGGGLGPFFDTSNAAYAQLKPAYTESGSKRLITLPNWTTPAGSLPSFVVGDSAKVSDYRLHFEFAIGASDWSNTNWFYLR
ncbi:MAG TPA: carboxypeptidase-like regulatory domain-containing protein, partial [Treponemataceae bacterium]|nr:carboxypeptidase-like regulatory domain-containing protein [Treponemataceae bacterium]